MPYLQFSHFFGYLSVWNCFRSSCFLSGTDFSKPIRNGVEYQVMKCRTAFGFFSMRQIAEVEINAEATASIKNG